MTGTNTTTIIILSILFVLLGIIAFVCLFTYVENRKSLKLARSFDKIKYDGKRILPQTDENGNYFFKTDEKLKILQITDIHLGCGIFTHSKDIKAINAVASMITAEKPDLVVITGDTAYPVPFQSGTINNKMPAIIIASLMEALDVYWITVFGNHDTELYSLNSRDKIGQYYESDAFPHSLFKKGDPSLSGCGNSSIKIINSDGIITQSLFMLDSHSYTDGDYFGFLWKYDNIKDNQVEWYENTVREYIDHNTSVINALYSADDVKRNEALKRYTKANTLIFFHIPLAECEAAWNEYKANGYKDTENVQLIYGELGEKNDMISKGIHKDKMFSTMEKIKGNIGVFFGHDHLNCYSVMYKGIKLSCSKSVDYLAYIGIKNYGYQRGCTIISVNPDGSFDNEPSNYYSDKYAGLNGFEKEQITLEKMPTAKLP